MKGIRSWIAGIGIVGILTVWTALFVKALIDNKLGDYPLLAVVLLVLFSSGPFVLYSAFIKTALGSVLVGSTLLIVTGAIYTNVFRNLESTAGLGFFVAAQINFLVVAMGVVTEWLIRKRST